MNRYWKTGVFAVALALSLLLGLARSAAAQTGPLPTFTMPSPAHFTLAGSTTVGPQMITTSATGMQVGDRFQQDFTASPAGGTPTMVNMIQIGMTFYFRFNGAGPWQTIDLSKTPGNVPTIQSAIPNLNGYTPNGGQRTYDAAMSSRQVGSEMIGGVATTRYDAPIDVAKLFLSLGTPAAQAAQAGAVSKMTLTLWIGDADQMLRQQRVLLNTKAAGPGGALLDVVVDFTITYQDIGSPVSIAAPADAVPYVPQPPAPPQVNPNPAPPRPEAVVRAFYDALNARDFAKARALAAPGLVFNFDAGTEFAAQQTLEEQIPGMQEHAAHFTVLSATAQGADQVSLSLMIQATDLADLPHPYISNDLATVRNGQIVAYEGHTSAQTLADLRALPPPGMPTTGAPNLAGPLALLALGLLCLLAGRLLWRRGAHLR